MWSGTETTVTIKVSATRHGIHASDRLWEAKNHKRSIKIISIYLISIGLRRFKSYCLKFLRKLDFENLPRN